MERHRRRRAIRVLIEGACTDTDESTVIRAPTDSLDDGMVTLCRETFTGSIVVSLWRLDARGDVARPSSTPPRATPRVSRSAAVLGSPPTAPRPRFAAPLGPLMGLPVDAAAVADVLSPSAISSRVSDARSRHRLTTPFTPTRRTASRRRRL